MIGAAATDLFFWPVADGLHGASLVFFVGAKVGGWLIYRLSRGRGLTGSRRSVAFARSDCNRGYTPLLRLYRRATINRIVVGYFFDRSNLTVERGED